MASSFIQSTLADTQTTVTSLGGALAGVAAERVGTMVLAQFPRQKSLGNVGLEFVARSVVASVAFSTAASIMPETSQNIFFSIIFFACNSSLISTGKDFANILIDAALPRGAKVAPTRPPVPGAEPLMPSPHAASAGCGKPSCMK